MTQRSRLSDSLRVAALVLVLGTPLAACDGSSEDPKPPIDSTLVDGKVCGLFDPDLVKSVIGHDEIKVRGTGIGDVTKRTDDTIDCDVVDDQRVRSTIQVIVAEQPDAKDHAAAETMLKSELASKPDCSQPAGLTELGTGYLCTQDNGQLQLNVLLPKRLVRLVYQPGPDAPGDPTATAVELVKDVDANVEAYDKKHG